MSKNIINEIQKQNKIQKMQLFFLLNSNKFKIEHLTYFLILNQK